MDFVCKIVCHFSKACVFFVFNGCLMGKRLKENEGEEFHMLVCFVLGGSGHRNLDEIRMADRLP